MSEPKAGDKFIVPGGDDEGEDKELTVREMVNELENNYFEVIAEEDEETYEIHDDGAGWTAD